MFLFFHQFVIGVGVISDRSMLPTLTQADTFLINKYIYHFTKPKRGDIVVFRTQAFIRELYVKRVIALEGERIAFQNGTVFIDGQPLNEPYITSKTYPNTRPLKIEPETVFVLGDNRADSEDSRRFGVIPLKRVEGKIQPGRLFPFR